MFLPALLLLTTPHVAQSRDVPLATLTQDLPRPILAAAQTGWKAATDTLHISVALPYADLDGMKSFVDSVSDPKSPSYRHFLTPDQVGARFGLPASAVKAVSDYLTSKGMKIRLSAKNRLSILADATVAQAQAAFHTAIAEFNVVLPGDFAPTKCFSLTSPPSVPTPISPFITTVGGLENVTRPRHCSLLSPDQFRTLYSLAPLYTSGFQGQGRTIAITNWSTYGLADVPLEYAQFNLPTPPGGVGSNITPIPVDGNNGNATGNEGGEGDMDIQVSLAMAPLCNLLIYDNAYGGDLIGVLTQEADDNLADFITESYAWNGDTSYFVAAHAIHLSMSAQGITYMCASGDWGSNGMVNLYYPDEDPEVLSVGGTSVSVDSFGNRLSEVVWNNAGGGGWAPNADPFNVSPIYQKGFGVPTGIPYRMVPDLALDADPGTGYELFINEIFQPTAGWGWGGTSASSPTMSGILAVAAQKIIAGGGLPADANGKRRFGRIQDLIYSFNGDPTVFYDITSGTNGSLPNGNPSNATPGWDTASGWGTIIASGFVDRVLGNSEPLAVTILPAPVVGGITATGTVTFNIPPASSGAIVSLSSNSPLAKVPSSIKLAPGATTATFSIATSGVDSATSVVISATSGAGTQTTTMTILPPRLQTLTLNPTSVPGGVAATGTVSLYGQAGPSGVGISLSSSGSNATVPAGIAIQPGSGNATFSIATFGLANSTTVKINASFSGTTVQAPLTITPATLAGVAASPNPVGGGTTAVGTVSLDGSAPPSGIMVTLASSSIDAGVPPSIEIAGGASSATFPVTTLGVAAATSATITAQLSGAKQTTSLSIQPGKLGALTLSPSSVVGGSSTTVTGMIQFTGAVVSPGKTVTLTSSAPSLATVPASVKITGDASIAMFAVTHKLAKSTQSVTITATCGGVSQTATLTLSPFQVSAVTLSPTSVTGSTAVVGMVILNAAPGTASGPIAVKLKSSSAGVTVPATVTVAKGSISGTFAVKANPVAAPTIAMVTATYATTSAQATLTVRPPVLVSLTVSPASVQGSSSKAVTGTVTLSGPAPAGGLVVTLTSSNAKAATVPATLAIPAGKSTATFRVTHTKVSAQTPVTLTASLQGTSEAAALTVTP